MTKKTSNQLDAEINAYLTGDKYEKGTPTDEGQIFYVQRGASYDRVQISGPLYGGRSWAYTVLSGPDQGRMGKGTKFFRKA